jgi:hypothetical protein
MRSAIGFVVVGGVLMVTVLPGASALGQTGQPADRRRIITAAPQSLQTEHRAIHDALTAATKVPGRVGVAAKQLAEVLDPHFKREDEIALPPLGLLAPLAAGEKPAGMEEALAMTEALRKELPQMLKEHQEIRAATERLRTAAREEKQLVHEQFAEDLMLHARTEEEVLYPAAILVGEIIRGRMRQKSRRCMNDVADAYRRTPRRILRIDG